MAGPASSNEAETDWRRLASDRNVSHDLARAMWEQARDASPDDPMLAQQAYQAMLEDAEAANATHEPGRETLVGRSASPRDAGSLGPGKWTRVLLEQPRPSAAPKVIDLKSTAAAIRSELEAAGQAGLQAAAQLAASDPDTIVEALRGLSQRQTGIVGQLLSIATSAVERALDKRDNWDAGMKQPKPATAVKRDPETGEPIEEEAVAPVAEDERIAPAPPPAEPPPAEPPADEPVPDEPDPG
ncbi:MAG TPA: hypothetical protein VGC42_05840 [Kofleriaceae bacterium]